jgi:DNA-binding beta-propeller fold protein YncE
MRLKEMVFVLIVALFLLPLVAAGDQERTTLVTPPWNHCLGLHKVTQFHLDVYSGYGERFEDPQGLFCVKLEQKDDRSTNRDDDELTVYGLNRGKHKLIYNKSLTSIGIVGGEGSDLGSFKDPRSVTGDEMGNLYIADTGNHRIVHMRYTEDDDLVAMKEFKGADDALIGPTGVSLSGGKLYVADSGNNRIAVFDTAGTLHESLRPIMEEERLRGPLSIAAVMKGDDWLYYNEFFIAVIDSLGKRLWKISPEGEVLAIARPNSSSSTFGHVAIDYYGNIYVTDQSGGCIHKYTRHLDYIAAFGKMRQFDEPRGITINRRFGQVFVSERAGAQYYWIGTDIMRFAAENCTIDNAEKRISVDISFLLTEHSTISIYIEDEYGERLHTFVDGYLLPAGVFSRRLEKACDNTELIVNKNVRTVVVARPTYSSRTFLTITRKSPPSRPHSK